MIKLRVFVSSVQKELAEERHAVKALISSDPFLDEHCVAILYEDEPSMLRPAPQGYLEDLAKCQIYLAIIGSEYGNRFKGLSATHHEYHFAHMKEMPVLVCVRGDNKTQRDAATDDFIAEIRNDGHKYHRFSDTRTLQGVILTCLSKHIKDHYHVAPAREDAAASARTVATAAVFDQERVAFVPDLNVPAQVGWNDIDLEIARRLALAGADEPTASLNDNEIKEQLLRRGLLWLSPADKKVYCSPAGILLLANNPAQVFPQCRVQLLAFQGKQRDPRPADFLDISAPIPKALDSALSFIEKNTHHPLRVVGINRVRLDEYPVTALREAIINALAHRDYEDATRKIRVELFTDRIEVISPGLLPNGVTLAQVRSGKARPCSRNPVLAQGLRLLRLMEEMGTGVPRMNQAMLDHGLNPPKYSVQDGCFIVTLHGPNGDYDRLRVPADTTGLISPAVEDKLNARQKRILHEAQKAGVVTSGWCRKNLPVVYDTIRRDLLGLVQLGLLEPRGKGRSTRYTLKTKA